MKKLNKYIILLVIMLLVPIFASGCSLTHEQYSIRVNSNNTNYGITYGSGTYCKGEYVIIVALPKEGYEFLKWSDGNTQKVRSIQVTENDKEYGATFIEKQKFYTLNSIELYIEPSGNIDVERVELFNLKIFTDSAEENLIGGFNINQNGSGIYWGMPLFINNISPVILSTENNPFVIYADKNNYNIFNENELLNLHFRYSYGCVESTENQDAYNHGYIGAQKNIFVNTSATNTVKTLYTDDQHNYSIMLKFNFVEL